MWINNFFNVLLVLFATIGIAALLWVIFGALILRSPLGGAKTQVILRVTGGEPDIERVVRSSVWLRDTLGAQAHITVLFDPMTAEMEACAALLASGLDSVEIGGPDICAER